MVRCICCGAQLDRRGWCVYCDVTLSSPPHPCLRSLEIVGDEDRCEPGFPGLARDHEIDLRADRPR
jgi:hypothetical protein